jgi:hypothetical protein
MSFEIITSLSASVLVSVVTAAVTEGAQYFKTFLDERKKLAAAEESYFRQVLASDSIDVLGRYLDNEVGNFLVSEYVSSDKARLRIDSIINSMQDFVGREKEVMEDLPIVESIARPTSPVSDEFRLIFSKLQSGIAWDALAALRRHIEIKLKQLISKKDILVDDRSSAGRLLSILSQKGLLANNVERQLRYAVDVANRAIHGHDVSISIAEEAVFMAQDALDKLTQLENTSNA